MIHLLEIFVLRNSQYLYADMVKQLFYSLLEVLYLDADKSSLSSAYPLVFLNKRWETEVWSLTWPSTRHANPCKCHIDASHTFLCGQTPECEVSIFVRTLIFVYQNTQRHNSDNRHFHTVNACFGANYESTQDNTPTCWVAWFVLVSLLRVWRGKDGCVWSSRSFLTSLDNDTISKLGHSIFPSFLSHYH
jgi:hypothetical protein